MSENGYMSKLRYRRALEALRNGVPNGDAVSVLGCNQPDVEKDFNGLLSRVSQDGEAPGSGVGMLVAGDFGSGKSHLLNFLESQALDQGFVCSRVVISKETPLFNMEKVFKAAVENARAPGITGHMVEEVALKLDYNSEAYSHFFQWANREDNGLHRIFPATLTVHERGRGSDLSNDIIWFWSGEKIQLKSVRDGLRAINQHRTYSFRAPTARDLPPQKFRFVLELIKAAGYRGWVVLMDEIELVANYTILQRARSYAELARWMGRASGVEYPGLITVGTVTADFASVVLNEKEDRDKAAARLRARQRDEDNIAAARAESGMMMLERGVCLLAEPDDDTLSALYQQLKTIHSEAYEWDAPEIDHGIRPGGRRIIRSFVRRWINEWDLRRLHPGFNPEIEETEFRFNYDEDRDLEQENRDGSIGEVGLPDDPTQG